MIINVGIIGYGKMGQIRAGTLIKHNKAHIHSVYDVSLKQIRKDNFKEASSPDEIINNGNIDAVFICTPNYLNQDLTIKALKAESMFFAKPPVSAEGVKNQGH